MADSSCAAVRHHGLLYATWQAHMLPVMGVSALLIGWCQGPGQESLPHYPCLQVCAADSTAAGSATQCAEKQPGDDWG
jgi:hypothetical protein